jgi:hypothetical protein
MSMWQLVYSFVEFAVEFFMGNRAEGGSKTPPKPRSTRTLVFCIVVLLIVEGLTLMRLYELAKAHLALEAQVSKSPSLFSECHCKGTYLTDKRIPSSDIR